jgi:alpha-tubulin suppressor-like RCC1 family protein
MRSIQRAGAITAILGALLCGVAPLPAQVSGDSTITATVFGDTLTIRTSNAFAGAISSLRWRNKEFVNIWDHGREFTTAFSAFNRFECYNAYETGSLADGQGPTSSAKLLSLSASGNTLDTNCQMCWYTHSHDATPGDHCGDPANWLPCPQYNGPLSNYLIHKNVKIGYAGMPNVIEYLTDLWIPEVARKGELQTVVAVLPYEFANLRSYDVVSKTYRNVRGIGGEDDSVKVLATGDGAYALGYYSPELLQPYVTESGGFRWGFALPDPIGYPNDPDFACAGFGGIDRFDTYGPGYRSDRSYLVIGNLDDVRRTLSDLHYQFRNLDPDVFNWRDYLTINQLQGALPDHGSAQAHWQVHGISEGRVGSKTFSPAQYLQLNPDLASALGATNYQGAIDHYIGTGRSEGRSTVAKPAAGMQHQLVFTNRIVNASGQNAFGQLGTSPSPSPPTHIVSLDNTVTEVAAGDYTSFAVKNDGTLWAWGSNQYGARGDGSSGDNIASPVQVPISARITTPTRGGKHAVAVGTGVYAAIDTEGQVWTWGVNWNGRLGNGNTTSRYTPARVQKSANSGDYLTGVVSITAGGGTLAALDADGNVWTWGAGANGALGNGFANDSSYPVQVIDKNSNTPLGGVTEVACGSSGFCLALARYGTVFGWGSNAFSQLGTAAGGFRLLATPINVGPYSSIDAIAAGSAHCIAHSTDGNVYGWGYNGRGQLGIGSSGVAQSTPVVMKSGPDNMNNVSDLAAGGNFSIMVRNSDRAVFVAGDNQSGQLGISSNQPAQSLPVRSSF